VFLWVFLWLQVAEVGGKFQSVSVRK